MQTFNGRRFVIISLSDRFLCDLCFVPSHVKHTLGDGRSNKKNPMMNDSCQISERKWGLRPSATSSLVDFIVCFNKLPSGFRAKLNWSIRFNSLTVCVNLECFLPKQFSCIETIFTSGPKFKFSNARARGLAWYQIHFRSMPICFSLVRRLYTILISFSRWSSGAPHKSKLTWK